MHATELWESKNPSSRFARIALWPLSLLYAVGWQCYLSIYRLGFKKAKHPHSPILCVGNLVSGGSGKTPLVLHMVHVLRELGYEVVVSSSGYGSPAAEAARVAPEGPLKASDWGDEAAMFRWLIPDLPLIVGRRRVLAAKLAHQNFPNAVLLMDDGFQHLPLKKALAIIVDPKAPTNPFCLPAGPYREPRFNRKRADLVIPGEFSIVEEPPEICNPRGEKREVATCTVLCALGQPQKVPTTLEEMGVKVKSKLFLPDHDPLTGGTLLDNLPIDLPVVVTAKDWVKLRERPDVEERDFLILKHAVRVEPKDTFYTWLKQRLNGIKTTSHPQ